MPAAARIRPLDLFTKEEWAYVSARNDWIGAGLVVHAWGVIALAMGLAIWSPWFIPLSIVLIGARQLGLAVLMHDAAHGGLARHRALNDFLGQWMTGAPVGAHLGDYRAYHLKHHKYAQQPEDPDLVLSSPFPVTKASFRRKIIRDLTGQTFLKQRGYLFARALGAGALRQQGAEPHTVATARRSVIPFVATNLVLFAILTGLGHAWAYFVLWLLPLATWNQLITRVRNIGEHALVPDNDDPMRHARTTKAGFLERLFLAPYWVHFHCEHHMFMHLPCYRLERAHKLLDDKGVTARMEVRKGYHSILREVMAKPA